MADIQHHQKIKPFLWFNQQAEAAATFYCKIFKDGKILSVSDMVVEFQIAGMVFGAINGGPYYEFSSATSFLITCEDQAEVDYFWESLLDGGGKPLNCGWLVDGYGVTWQVVPQQFLAAMQDGSPEQKKAVFDAIMPMKKLLVAEIEAAYKAAAGLVTVNNVVNAAIEVVWEAWTSPDHIVKWNHASDDWHTTSATNDLQVGGRFSSRMEAKDGSMGFDFAGSYIKVVPQQRLVYVLDDERQVTITFAATDKGVAITETFHADNHVAVELQRTGWQAILDQFKRYAEAM